MPFFKKGEVEIYYEEFGQGFPLFLLAPGFMNSSIAAWTRREPNPISAFSHQYRVIAMDQRHAGQSRAPVTAEDDWSCFTEDQMGLLDHLEVERCHIWGACIGVPYALGLMAMSPGRFVSGVFENPVGQTDRALEFRPFGAPDQDRSKESNDNRDSLMKLYADWVSHLVEKKPEINPETLMDMGRRMMGKEFVFTVSREFVRTVETPLLILPGDDIFHPPPTAEEIAGLARNTEILASDWRTSDNIGKTYARVDAFLKEHTPADASVGSFTGR